MMTHVFGDIATATRIESTAKTMSVSSTFTTVAQKADSPSQGRAGLTARRSPAVAAAEEVAPRQVQQVAGPDQLDPRHLQQVHGEQRREDPEGERAENAVAERLALLAARQAEHQDGEDQRVVGAEQSLEQDEQGNGQEIGGVNVHRTAGQP